MRSFRVKLALIMTLAPGAIVLAFGSVAWWVLYEQQLDAVDARMSIPAEAFHRRVSARMDSEDFDQLAASFTRQGEGSDDRLLDFVVVMRNDSAEVISESRADLETLIPFEAHLPLPDDFVEAPEYRVRSQGPPRRPDDPRRGGGGGDRDGDGRGGGRGGGGDRDRDGDGRGGGRGGSGGDRPPFRVEHHLVRPPMFFTAENQGSRWRVGAFSNLFATVFVGVDLAPFDAEVQRLQGLFLSGLLGALCLTAVAGWFIASKAMRPIRRITETAERVTARGLDERIPMTGREDRELARLVHVLNDMMERLERSFHHAARFSADASHELKTPLAIMRGELERALQECQAGAPQEQTFLNLSEEVHRLHKITEALLMLSRADAGSLPLHQTTFSVSEALESFCEDAQILCNEQGLRFSTEIQPDLWIHADRPILLSVLHNLLSNAIKYNETDGRVEIRAREQGQFVRLEVGNTGPGIPNEQRSQVFRRFHRGDEARSRKVDGFGLGLNIALELVQASGGSLRLLDAGSGDEMTCFAITLPKAEAPSE